MRNKLQHFSALLAWALLFWTLCLQAGAQPMGHPMGQAANPVAIPAILAEPRWSPYVIGIGIGVLSWIAFLLSDHPIGVSTAYARTSGMLEKLVRGAKVDEKAYYQKYKPQVDWEWMLVLGLLAGAWLSAWLSGSFAWEWTPPLWKDAFGASPVIRWLAAVGGGFLIGLGARWAGGCTSGHGISGTLQLVVSSWLALLCFFVGGSATAMCLHYLLA